MNGGFSLALGGGGGRGWAHIGVARALEEAGLRPRRIVGTSMGAIVGAGLAAGFPPREIERVARRTPVYRLVGRRARHALFDPRPVIERLGAALGDPRIEDLPVPLAITTYDLATGTTAAITRGRVVEAIQRAIAVPLFFPPCPDGEHLWCDAGPWEAVPVSVARRLAPADPVIGVWVDSPKPAVLAARPVAAAMRGLALRLASAPATTPVPTAPLPARGYLALLARAMAAPVLAEAPDLLIRPRLGIMPAWHFSRVREMSRRGYRDARTALEAAGLWPTARADGMHAAA
ncbi:MAG TPA: patatin-like phospholipase family protein [Candidatus Limnocylindria bacterium]